MPSTKRWGGLRPAPYNPNARDADGDGIVQEGTMWERPGGSRFVDRAGKLISAAISHAVDGAHIVDSGGNPVDYKPQRGGTPGVPGSGADAPNVPDVPDKVQPLPSLAAMGAKTIGETLGTVGSPKPSEVERLREEVEAAIPPNPLEPHGPDGPRLSFLAEDVDTRFVGEAAFVTVPADKTLTKKKLNARVKRVISKDELPDEIFHITTAKDAVDGDGMLKVAMGGEGLGGGPADDLSVSVTTDRDVAETLLGDMKAYFGWMRGDYTHDETREHLRRLAREDGWAYEPPSTDTGVHWLWADYLQRRESNSPKHQRNPLFVGLSRDADPKQVKMYTIKKEDIPDDVVITDFDMNERYGLEEARIWGDIPTRGAVDAQDPQKLIKSPVRESSTAAVPLASEPLGDVNVTGTLVSWQPERGLTPSARHPDSDLYDIPGYEDYEGTLPPVPRQETFTLPSGETLRVRATDPHAAERDRLFSERRINDFNERRRRKALGTERTWDHPARVDRETPLGNVLHSWRSGFAESASYRRIINGEDPAPAYDNQSTRERVDILAEALEGATPLGLDQWRLQTGIPEVGEIVDFPAASTAVERREAEGFIDSVSIFDDIVEQRGSGPPPKVLYHFPGDSPGIFHDDETDYPREAIVTGRYRIESVTPDKIGNKDVMVAELEWVDRADIARLEEPKLAPPGSGQTIARRVIPEDLTDFDGEASMQDIVGEGAELWHVTTARDALRSEGFKEGGAGFGTDLDAGPKGVSVTYNKHAADSFEDQIKAAIYAANGGDDNNAILAPIFNATNDEVTARDLAEEMGLDTDGFVDEWDVDALVREFDGDSFDLYAAASQAAMDIQTERMDFAEPYDDFDEPGPRGLGWTIMPVVSDRDKLRGLDPDQVGTVKIASRGEATAADSLTHELRFDTGDIDVVSDRTHLDDVDAFDEIPLDTDAADRFVVHDEPTVVKRVIVNDDTPQPPSPELVDRLRETSDESIQEHDDVVPTGGTLAGRTLNEYQHGKFVGINQKLRNGEEISGEDRAKLEALTAIIEATTFEEDYTVYRGLKVVDFFDEGPEPGEDTDDAIRSLIGATISDSGFLSTTVDPDVGESYGTSRDNLDGDAFKASFDEDYIVVRIEVPAGTSGLYRDTRWEEQEVVMLPGQEFEVTDVEVVRNPKSFAGGDATAYVVNVRAVEKISAEEARVDIDVPGDVPLEDMPDVADAERTAETVFMFDGRPTTDFDYLKEDARIVRDLEFLNSPEGEKYADQIPALQARLDDLREAKRTGRAVSGPGSDPIPIAPNETRSLEGMSREEWDALGDDEWVEVLHSTFTESAGRFLGEGITGKDKPRREGDEIRMERGETGEGVYVGRASDITDHYSHDPEGLGTWTTLKIKVRKKDVLKPKEVPSAHDAFRGLQERSAGAVIFGDIPAENISFVSRTGGLDAPKPFTRLVNPTPEELADAMDELTPYLRGKVGDSVIEDLGKWIDKMRRDDAKPDTADMPTWIATEWDIIEGQATFDVEEPKLAPRTPTQGVEIVDATNQYVSDKIGYGSHVETTVRNLLASNMGDPDLGKEPLSENAPSALTATRRYTGEGWRDINGFLRGRTGDISEEDSGVIETLDRLVDSSPVSQDHTVYRGVRASTLVGEAVNDDDVSEALGDLLGETVSDGGFVSTSINPHSATRFAQKRKKGEGPSGSPPVVMRINVPEGTGAYYVNSRYDEKEVILARDTELRITGVVELQNLKNGDGQSSYILDVEVVEIVGSGVHAGTNNSGKIDIYPEEVSGRDGVYEAVESLLTVPQDPKANWVFPDSKVVIESQGEAGENAIIAYVRNSIPINNDLRSGSVSEENRETVDAFDNLFEALPPSKGGVTYRGSPMRTLIGDVDVESEEELDALIANVVGSVIADDGILSTSTRLDTGLDFARDNRTTNDPDGYLLLEIEVSEGGEALAVGTHPGIGESEVLLPNGLEYDVVSVDKIRSADGDYPTYVAKLVQRPRSSSAEETPNIISEAADVPREEAAIPDVPRVETSADFSNRIAATYPDIKFDLETRAGTTSDGKPMVYLSRIVIPEDSRDSGFGTEIMNDLTQWADNNGRVVVVSPSADFGGDKDRLDEFYGRFGFVPNKGKDKDYAITGTMYREPKEQPKLAPEYSDYGPFADGQDYLNQYSDAPEADRPALMQASSNQDAAYVEARREHRIVEAVAEAESNPIELPEPRDTPQRPSMTSTTGNLEIKGSPVKHGVKVEDSIGEYTLDLSRHGIDQRVNSLTTQIGEDFGIEVEKVHYALSWEEWHAMDLTADHAGALAFYQDGEIFISPAIALKLGSNDPGEYYDGIRVLSHEMGHGASGAVKNNLANTGLRPIPEEAGAEISALYYAQRRFDAELLDATKRDMPGIDGPLTYTGTKAVYLDAGYPERVEEMVLQSVRRNGWNREAALNDIMYTFTEGDPVDFMYDDDGKVVRIFPQNVDGRGAQVDPIAEIRWRQIWDQAPVDIREPYRDVDPGATYAADRPVVGEAHLTEADWVERQVRVASLLHWLFEDDGTGEAASGTTPGAARETPNSDATPATVEVIESTEGVSMWLERVGKGTNHGLRNDLAEAMSGEPRPLPTQEAFAHYREHGPGVSEWLRGGRFPEASEAYDDFTNDDVIRNAVIMVEESTNPLPTDLTLFRGGNTETFGFLKGEDPSNLVGLNVTYGTLTSTSVDDSVASDFAKHSRAGDGVPYVLRMEAPAGTMGAYIDDPKSIYDEGEVVLPPGARVEIVNVTRVRELRPNGPVEYLVLDSRVSTDANEVEAVVRKASGDIDIPEGLDPEGELRSSLIEAVRSAPDSDGHETPKLAPGSANNNPAAIPEHKDIEWKSLNRQQPGNAVIAEQLIPQGNKEIGGSETQKIEAKQQSVEGIAGRLSDNEDIQKWAAAAGPYDGRYDDDIRNWIDQQISAWAEMDGPKVDEINAAIGRVFNIPGYNLFDEDDEVGKGAAYDALVTAMYQETQAFLADGPDEYVFFRGLLGQNYSGELNDGIDAWQELLDIEWGGQLGDFPGYVYTDAILEGRPGASWSAAYPTAKEFAQGGVVLTVTVPKESILSTPQSGMGALFEDEVILLDHGRNPVTVLTASQTSTSYGLAEDAYRSFAGSGDFDLSGNIPFPLASNRAGQKRAWSNAVLDSFNNRGVWVDLDTPPDEADPQDIADIIERFKQ